VSTVRVSSTIGDLRDDLLRISKEAPVGAPRVVREGIRVGNSVAKDNAGVTSGAHGKLYPAPSRLRDASDLPLRRWQHLLRRVRPGRTGRPQGGMSFEWGSRNQPPHLDLNKSADLIGPALQRRDRRRRRSAVLVRTDTSPRILALLNARLGAMSHTATGIHRRQGAHDRRRLRRGHAVAPLRRATVGSTAPSPPPAGASPRAPSASERTTPRSCSTWCQQALEDHTITVTGVTSTPIAFELDDAIAEDERDSDLWSGTDPVDLLLLTTRRSPAATQPGENIRHARIPRPRQGAEAALHDRRELRRTRSTRRSTTS
jgi:hypothetical protein